MMIELNTEGRLGRMSSVRILNRCVPAIDQSMAHWKSMSQRIDVFSASGDEGMDLQLHRASSVDVR